MKSEKKDLDEQVKFLRRLSVKIADLAYQIGIKPNQITLFRFFVLGGSATVLLCFNNMFFNLAAVLLLFANFMLDLVDGDLARRHNLKSQLGGALEENLDSLLLSLLVLAISISMYISNSPIAVAGLVCLFAQIFSKHYTDLYKQRFDIDCVESNPALEVIRNNGNVSTWTRIFIELLAPKNIIFSLFSNFRYFLLVGVVLNRLPESFLAYTIAINIRWIMLLLLTILYASGRKADLEIMQVLSRLDRNKNTAKVGS